MKSDKLMVHTTVNYTIQNLIRAKRETRDAFKVRIQRMIGENLFNESFTEWGINWYELLDLVPEICEFNDDELLAYYLSLYVLTGSCGQEVQLLLNSRIGIPEKEMTPLYKVLKLVKHEGSEVVNFNGLCETLIHHEEYAIPYVRKENGTYVLCYDKIKDWI